jgi:hypothetical protein
MERILYNNKTYVLITPDTNITNCDKCVLFKHLTKKTRMCSPVQALKSSNSSGPDRSKAHNMLTKCKVGVNFFEEIYPRKELKYNEVSR